MGLALSSQRWARWFPEGKSDGCGLAEFGGNGESCSGHLSDSMVLVESLSLRLVSLQLQDLSLRVSNICGSSHPSWAAAFSLRWCDA